MNSHPISKNMLNAWQKTVIALSRLSTKDKQDPDLSGIVRKLARIEKANILNLRDAFTTERESLTYDLLSNKENIIAYMLGFHLQNIYRLAKTFERVQEKWNWSLKDLSQKSSLTVWDLGCGSGALSQFFIENFASHFDSSRAYLYDTNSLLLNASKTVFDHLKIPNLRVFPRKVGLHDLNTKPQVFEGELVLIGLGYVWNEIQKNKSAQKKIRELIQHYLQHKAKILISVMEPGQDFASRSAMELRDELTTLGFTPLYPCPHLRSCPMLKRDKDWCYSEFSSEALPKDAQYIDELLEIERTMIASSAYVFVSPSLKESIQTRIKQEPIVVGRPRTKDESSFSYLLCTPEGEIEKKEPGIRQRGVVTLRGEKISNVF